MSQVQCPQCRRILRLPSEADGRTVRCKGCHAVFPVLLPEDDLDERVLRWLLEDDNEEDFVGVHTRAALRAMAGLSTAG